MSGRYFINLAALTVALIVAAVAVAQPLSKADVDSGPIVITSDTLWADSKASTALFKGNVVAKTNDITLRADRMTVHYSEGGDVRKIDVEGNVKLLKEERTVTSEKALYLSKEEKIIFTGEPMVVEGQNVITGSEITYLIDEDRSVVKDSKVYIKRDAGN